MYSFTHWFIFLLKTLSEIPDFTGSQTAGAGQHWHWKHSWWQQQSILFPCGFFCLKWVSIFSTGQRAFIAPAFHRSDTVPGMWFRQRKTCLVRGHTFSRPGWCFSNVFLRLHCSTPSRWPMCQIPGLDTCKEIIHMIPSLFLTLFKKRNKTLQYYQHDSMLFLDFKILRLDVLMIFSGVTFTRPARVPLASTLAKGMAMCSQHNPCHPSCLVLCSRTRAYGWWGYKLPTL